MENKSTKSPIQVDDIKREKIEESIESMTEKATKDSSKVFIEAFMSALKGEKGDRGEKGDKGDAGDNYELTNLDKREIANLAYSIIAEKIDDDIQESASDVMVAVEAKLPDSIKNAFQENKEDITKIVQEYIKPLSESIKKENKTVIQKVVKERAISKTELEEMNRNAYEKFTKEVSKAYKDYVKKVGDKVKKEINWNDISGRPNIVTALAHLTDVDKTNATSATKVLVPKLDVNGALVGFEFADQSGGGLTEVAVTGTPDDVTVAFGCETEPTYVVINGVWYKSTGGVYTWSWSANVLTLSSPIGTGSQIWAFA